MGLSKSLYANRSPGCYPLADLGNAFCLLPLFDQRPSPDEGSPCDQIRKTLGAGKRNDCLSSFLGFRAFSAQAVERSSELQGKSLAERMSKLMSQHQRFLTPFKRLVGIAKVPQDP